jgi:probable rRNA maturation factor
MIEINNLSSFKIKESLFKRILKEVLEGEGLKEKRISVAFVKSDKIKEINSQYRKKESSTDVLSFSFNDNEFLGEIIICPEKVKQNANEFGVPFEKELVKVFIHGILHLLGFDHEKNSFEAKKMKEKEENYLKLYEK